MKENENGVIISGYQLWEALQSIGIGYLQTKSVSFGFDLKFTPRNQLLKTQRIEKSILRRNITFDSTLCELTTIKSIIQINLVVEANILSVMCSNIISVITNVSLEIMRKTKMTQTMKKRVKNNKKWFMQIKWTITLYNSQLPAT